MSIHGVNNPKWLPSHSRSTQYGTCAPNCKEPLTTYQPTAGGIPQHRIKQTVSLWRQSVSLLSVGKAIHLSSLPLR